MANMTTMKVHAAQAGNRDDQFGVDSNEYYERMFREAEEPSGVLVIHREPSIYSLNMPDEPDRRNCKGVVHISFALILPLPYGALYGTQGRWTLTSFLYLWTFVRCPPTVDAHAVKPALLVWCIIGGLLFLIFWGASGKAVVLAVFTAYYFINAALFCLFWAKAVCCNGNRRLFYETVS